MIQKKLLRPERLRKTPPQFSWIDHRLIRQDRLKDCHPPAWALYLFLACVGDERGLSFYSDASLSRTLRLDLTTLSQARAQLLQAGLVAFEAPLWQVLSLDPETSSSPRGQQRSVAQILQSVLQGGAQ